MSPIAQPPPAPWKAPLAPLQISRTFHPVAPYAAGGHRGIDLRARPGDAVRSPCPGTVVFRGAVAGGPPTITIRCGALRATLQRVQPAIEPGAAVDAGRVIGRATGNAVDLSARRPDDTYVDPATLLGRGREPRVPPAVAPRRPASPNRHTQHAAQVVDRALVTPHGAPETKQGADVQGVGVDRPLGIAGATFGGIALAVLATGAARRRRVGPGRVGRALTARAQR